MNANSLKLFDEVFESILKEFPSYVHDMIEEFPIIVSDEPSPEQLEELEIELDDREPSDLCGLHAGIPLSERSVLDADVPLPRYDPHLRGPIVRLSFGEDRELGEDDRHSMSLRRQIRITILHELGHHVGLSEERLEQLGYE